MAVDTDRRKSRALLRKAVPEPVRRVAWSLSAQLEQTQQRLFERRLGVSTGGHVYLDEQDLDSDRRTFYEGCQWLPVRRALKALAPGPGDLFVDLGSGKGQALLIAGQLPFGRVIGVDLMEDLTTAARANIKQARPRLRARAFE